MQELIRGDRSVLEIGGRLQEGQREFVLFVTGGHLEEDALFRELCSCLKVPYRIIHPPDGVLQVDTIPTFQVLDTLIAIGGGKVIDYAKGILMRHPTPVPFIAVPTTAGSGSEATPVAVFYKGKEKVSLDAPSLLPHVAILDPVLLTNLPARQRAISGADAMAQCIESVWSVSSNSESEEHALEGLKILWQDLVPFVNGAGGAITGNVLWAAHLAGKAIALTRTTGPHAFSYFLTAHYGVPHGQAVALTLPLFFLFNDGEHTSVKLKKLYRILNVQNAQEAFAACRQMIRQIGLAISLDELQLAHISLDDWLQSVNQQRFSNNPQPFDASRLKELFQQHLC